MVDRRLTPHTARLREILSDGKWHSRDELIAKCGPLVQAGQAMRRREKSRKNQRKEVRDRPQIRRDGEYSDEYYIAIGRRNIIVDSFSSLKGLEFRDEDGKRGKRWIRDNQARARLAKERHDGRAAE